MGGGISRWMSALVQASPPGAIVVSTGTLPDADRVDATLHSRVDRVPLSSHRLKTLPGLLQWSRRAAVLARDERMRFAWCGTVRPAIYPAAWCHRATGLPFGVIVHGSDVATLARRMARSRARHAMFASLLGRASVFVANSTDTAARCAAFLSQAGLSAPVEVVALGADPARFGAGREAGAAFRRSRNLPDGEWMVTVARLVPHKGIDVAILALAALGPGHPRLRYLVVGRGPDRERLERLARELDVASRVHILTDVTDAELPAAYAMGDVYAGPSRAEGIEVEGFGISLAEAAASGLPVVAGRSGGVADAVQDGVTGVLVDPTDVGALAAAVGALLGDDARRTALGRAGRARVEAELNWQRMSERMRSLAAAHGRA